jgi:peroxiredoxin
MSENIEDKVGGAAPDFELKDQDGEKATLSEHRGKMVLLSFHPLAWTSVCAKQMISLEENMERFRDLNTVPVGISCDPVPSKKAWAESIDIEETRLPSDFWPHGEYSRKLGLFRERSGTSERANVIVDPEGKIIFAKVYPSSEVPDIDEIIEFLETKQQS